MDELEILKERLGEKEYFNRLKVTEWEMKPGIPSQDIVWPNVSGLLLIDRVQRFKSFLKPCGLSILLISSILILEKTLEFYWSSVAPLLL